MRLKKYTEFDKLINNRQLKLLNLRITSLLQNLQIETTITLAKHYSFSSVKVIDQNLAIRGNIGDSFNRRPLK